MSLKKMCPLYIHVFYQEIWRGLRHRRLTVWYDLHRLREDGKLRAIRQCHHPAVKCARGILHIILVKDGATSAWPEQLAAVLAERSNIPYVGYGYGSIPTSV